MEEGPHAERPADDEWRLTKYAPEDDDAPRDLADFETEDEESHFCGMVLYKSTLNDIVTGVGKFYARGNPPKTEECCGRGTYRVRYMNAAEFEKYRTDVQRCPRWRGRAHGHKDFVATDAAGRSFHFAPIGKLCPTLRRQRRDEIEEKRQLKGQLLGVVDELKNVLRGRDRVG